MWSGWLFFNPLSLPQAHYLHHPLSKHMQALYVSFPTHQILPELKKLVVAKKTHGGVRWRSQWIQQRILSFLLLNNEWLENFSRDRRDSLGKILVFWVDLFFSFYLLWIEFYWGFGFKGWHVFGFCLQFTTKSRHFRWEGVVIGDVAEQIVSDEEEWVDVGDVA